MMKSVLIDASSAILLFKAELFLQLVEIYRLCAVPSVINEITVADRPGALFFHEMVSKGMLAVEPVEITQNIEPAMGALDMGERDTMLAFRQNIADFIIIDDRKGALWCRSRNIPYINALLCTKILYLSGRMSKASHLDRFQQMLKIGRYSRWVIDFAQCCKEKDLALFLPDKENSRHLTGINGWLAEGSFIK